MVGGENSRLSLIGAFTGNVTESFAQLTLWTVTNEWRTGANRALIGSCQR